MTGAFSGLPKRWLPSSASWVVAAWGGVTGLVVAALCFPPAAALAWLVYWVSDGRVVLALAQGSLWQGSAQLVLTAGPGAKEASSLPERVTWRLRPAMLGAHADVQAACCTRRAARVALRLGWAGLQVDIKDVQVQWPAQWLAGLGAPWNTLAPQGLVALNAPQIQAQWVARRWVLMGQATADLMAMSSRLSTLAPLGDYRVIWRGGETASLQLETRQGALRLTGSGQWVGSRLRFSGEASAAPEHQDALNNVLNIIGRRQGAKSVISLG